MTRTVWTYLLIMIVLTNLIRILPVTLIRRRITNSFLRSFLYYVPYVTLAVMTIPAMIQATASPLAGGAAFATGVVAAWKGLGLFPIALICCLVVLVIEMLPL